jgi:hypothetical protein
MKTATYYAYLFTNGHDRGVILAPTATHARRLFVQLRGNGRYMGLYQPTAHEAAATNPRVLAVLAPPTMADPYLPYVPLRPRTSMAEPPNDHRRRLP